MYFATLPSRRAALHALALIALSLIAIRLAMKPVLAGDGVEYFSMLESFWNHGSPEQRLGDVESLSRVLGSHGISIARPHDGFFVTFGGRWYSYHFWIYPLFAVPAKAVLRLVGGDEFGALSWTNAWMLVATTAWALGKKPRLARVAFLGLAMLGPLFWYVRWPHAEVFAWACVVTSLVSLEDRRYVRAATFAGLGALQAPPIALLALLAAAFAAADAGPGRARRIAMSLVAAASAAGAPLFFWLEFGVPNLITATGGADPALVSWRRTWSLVCDLDQGLVGYMPATLGLGLAGLAASLLRPGSTSGRGRPLAVAVVTVAMMAASTSTTNFNAGCAGMNRYDVWLAPLFAWFGARLIERGAASFERAKVRTWATAAASIGGATLQLAILGRGDAADDAHEHGALASFVLTYAPELYDPVPEVFAERTMRRSLDASWRVPTPVAFFRPYGIATKLLVDRDSFADVPHAFQVDDAWFDAASKQHAAQRGLFYVHPPLGAVRARLADPPVAYTEGWYEPEGLGNDRWRWMGTSGSIVLRTLAATKGLLRLGGWVAAELPADPTMTVRIDGRTVDRFKAPRQRFTRDYPIDAASDQITVTLETTDAVTPPRDERALGFALLQAAIVPARRTSAEQGVRFVGDVWGTPFGDESAPIRCMTGPGDLHLEPLHGVSRGSLILAIGVPADRIGRPSRVTVSIDGVVADDGLVFVRSRKRYTLAADRPHDVHVAPEALPYDERDPTIACVELARYVAE